MGEELLKIVYKKQKEPGNFYFKTPNKIYIKPKLKKIGYSGFGSRGSQPAQPQQQPPGQQQLPAGLPPGIDANMIKKYMQQQQNSK